MKPDRAKALMLAQREISSLVHNAVELEGIHFTLPEIQTLLDGITVGGRKLLDQKIAVNQGKAWQYLFASIKNRTFAVSKDFACELHAIAGEEEALEWGKFRSGGVTIAGTDYMPPRADQLDGLFTAMIQSLDAFPDVYDKAIHVFLTMARYQFFYDVNKRMGRFMMNGILLDAGYPVINLPASRQLEFNQLMLAFYDSGDEAAMNGFLRSCLDERIVRIMSE
jgi:Fic family protein